MDLFVFIILVLVEGIAVYWVLGNVYSLMRKPAVVFPLSLASKMALASIIGAPLAGFGGILLAIFIFHVEFSKRRDYKIVSGIVAGIIISLSWVVLLYISVTYLGWAILS